MVRAADLQAHDTQSQDQLDRLMQRMETLQHLAEQVNAAIDATPSDRPSTSGSRPPTADGADSVAASDGVASSTARPPTRRRRWRRSTPRRPRWPTRRWRRRSRRSGEAAAKADDDDAASSLGGRRRRVDARAAEESACRSRGAGRGGAKENGSSPANRAPSALEAVEAEERRLSQSFRGLDQQIRRLNRDSRG